MIWSISVYFLPMLAISFGLSNNLNIKLLSIITTSIIIFLILGMRYDVGNDYSEYIWRLNQNIPPREPLSHLIFYIARWLGSNDVFFMIYALLTAMMLCMVSVREKNIWIVMNYISLPWFFHENFSAVRQGLSIVLMIVSYYHFKKYNDLRSLAFGLLAISAHYAATPFVLLLCLLSINSSKVLKTFIFIILLIILINIEQIFLGLRNHLSILNFYSDGASFGFGQFVLLCLLVTIASGASNSRDQSFILWVGVIIFYITMSINSALSRLAWFFIIPLLWYDWGTLMKYVRLRGTDKLSVICVLSFLIAVNLSIKSLDKRNSLVPYQTIINNPT